MSKIFIEHGESIKKMTEDGMTGREIAKILKIGKSTVSSLVKKHGFEKYKITLTEEQKEVLIGTIIGDGCLFKSTDGSNARMNLAHSLSQKEYFLYKYEIMKPIIRTKPYRRTWVDERTGNEYSEIRFQTRVHPMFTELRESFYPHGKRVIRKEHLKNRGELCLAIKYFDDGFKHGEKAYNFAMQDYDVESLNAFRSWMSEKFGIETNLHSDNGVYVPVSQVPKLKRILLKYATDDVLYKI